jgi:hypothetical protein
MISRKFPLTPKAPRSELTLRAAFDEGGLALIEVQLGTRRDRYEVSSLFPKDQSAALEDLAQMVAARSPILQNLGEDYTFGPNFLVDCLKELLQDCPFAPYKDEEGELEECNWYEPVTRAKTKRVHDESILPEIRRELSRPLDEDRNSPHFAVELDPEYAPHIKWVGSGDRRWYSLAIDIQTPRMQGTLMHLVGSFPQDIKFKVERPSDLLRNSPWLGDVKQGMQRAGVINIDEVLERAMAWLDSSTMIEVRDKTHNTVDLINKYRRPDVKRVMDEGILVQINQELDKNAP